MPSIKVHYSLHKVTSYCRVSLYKGAQHLCERNTVLFSKRLTAVQNYKGVQHFFQRNIELFQRTYSCAKFCSRGKGVYGRRTELRQKDRITTKRNPLINHFYRLWYSLKQGWCKYVQGLLHKGVNHVIQNHALIQKTHYFEVEPLGVCTWLFACNTPFHMFETPELDNIILKKLSLSFEDNCHSE